MLRNRFTTLFMGSLVVLSLSVACGDDSGDDDDTPTAGKGGKGGSSAGSGGKAGSPGNQAGTAGKAGAGGKGGAGGKDGVAGTETGGNPAASGAGGEGGSDPGALGGAAGQGGADAQGGEGGSGGEDAVSCESARATLLGPIASVSTGLVTISSEEDGVISVVVDGSAGGIAAAATNPYIYVSLASKARVEVSDVQADASTAWDIAFKRDNIRSNNGDSGPGQAQIAALDAADFDTVTGDAATTATFERDQFIDPATCEAILDATNKPLTSFDGWYDYDPVTNGLAPADKVYLVRSGDGTALYKLKLTAYYAEVSDGAGGTVRKSAVYSFKYKAL